MPWKDSEKRREYNRRYIREHYEYYLIKERERRLKRKEYYRNYSRVYMRTYIKRKFPIENPNALRRIKALNLISNDNPECKKCGLRDINFLSFDHINNDGNIDRKKYKNNATSNSIKEILSLKEKNKYQILCYNCNCSKNRTTSDLRKKVIAIISKNKNECECCGEKNINYLTLDHINNDGNIHRKRISKTRLYTEIIKENKPLKHLQILCYNCNCGKAYAGKGICPHELINKEKMSMFNRG